MKIVADVNIPFLRGALEPYAGVIYLPGREIDNKVLKDADALIIRTRTRCNESLLKDTAVRFIGTATIGYDHIDTSWCEDRGIFWTNAPGCNSSSVQQYIASALLTVSSDFQFLLKGKTIGIIGVGNVGSKIEKFARAVGMNVILNDPPRARAEGGTAFTDLRTVLSEADIVTVHVPLTVTGDDRTYHLFDSESFNNMKNRAWFFNSSRGEVAETAALIRKLKEPKLAGAVIDVWEHEPNIDKDLLSGVYLGTPHIAGYSTDGKANGTAMVVNSLIRFFNLPTDNWYPEDIPRPSSPELIVECRNKSDEDILRSAVIHTYDIKSDDIKLRKMPSDFEKLRGSYPLRREFSSYTIRLVDGSAGTKDLLRQLGFQVAG